MKYSQHIDIISINTKKNLCSMLLSADVMHTYHHYFYACFQHFCFFCRNDNPLNKRLLISTCIIIKKPIQLKMRKARVAPAFFRFLKSGTKQHQSPLSKTFLFVAFGMRTRKREKRAPQTFAIVYRQFRRKKIQQRHSTEVVDCVIKSM